MSPTTITMLSVGLVLVLIGGVGILVFMLKAITTSQMNERLMVYAGVPEDRPQRVTRNRRIPLTQFRMQFNQGLSGFIPNKLSLQLMSANWPITESEYIMIRVWLTATGLILGWVLGGSPIPGVGMAFLGYIAPVVYLNYAIKQRRLKFASQLIDVLMLLTGAIRAGYSFQQSLTFVIEEMKAPACEEFRRVQYEINLGLPLGDALNNLTERMENEDLYLLVTAININAQVGGNLVVMLRSVTETIRDRIRLFSELRALTAQQRFNTYLLTLLPFAFAAILLVMNPTYILRLFEPGPTPWVPICFPIGAVISTMLGNIIIRRLAHIDV